jgi:hypothetical protein
MPSKTKESRSNQKMYWKDKLNQRLSLLGEKGLDPAKIAKDPTVRKLRALIRETETRLRAIVDREKKKEEMARIKAEKASVPKPEKAKKTKETETSAEESKRQKKKKEKKAQKESPDEEE